MTPRTITTVDELDALPVGAVVYAANSIGPAERFREGWFGCRSLAGWSSSILAREGLPAVMLWEPAQLTTNHLQAATEAHREALAAQQAMQAASRVRDAAVRDAHASGCTMQQIADALGISRGRVNHIIHPIPKKPKD